MSFAANIWDISLALAIIAGNFLVDAFFLVPLPRLSPGAIAIGRHRCYYALLIFLWAAAAAICALWHFENRDWGLLLLAAPMSWRFLLGMAVAGALLLLLGFQHVHTLRRARNDPTQPVSFGSPVLDAMVPRSRGENHLFALVAVAAGICEELLFRGFLMTTIAS
ncbi:MAG TPA: hypothetical protein VHU23_04630 [Rhizomicrobium sp.]|jgi:membrane protease YdiL (CAAX protease family)|nr:hypothetical protein [Rhizomicrobium sp.]